jgi:hypothetical protein
MGTYATETCRHQEIVHSTRRKQEVDYLASNCEGNANFVDSVTEKNAVHLSLYFYCMYVSTYVWMYECMCVCMYICMCVRLCVCMYVHICVCV